MAKRKYTKRASRWTNNNGQVTVSTPPAPPAMVTLDSVLPMLSTAHRDMISGLLAIGVSAEHAVEAAAKLAAPAPVSAPPARQSAIPVRHVEPNPLATEAASAPAPRMVRPAVAYRLSSLAQSKEPAVKQMIASLSPRLAVTFEAIRRSRQPLSRRDISAATQREPKQTENDVMWLRTRGLIESVAAE